MLFDRAAMTRARRIRRTAKADGINARSGEALALNAAVLFNFVAGEPMELSARVWGRSMLDLRRLGRFVERGIEHGEIAGFLGGLVLTFFRLRRLLGRGRLEGKRGWARRGFSLGNVRLGAVNFWGFGVLLGVGIGGAGILGGIIFRVLGGVGRGLVGIHLDEFELGFLRLGAGAGGLVMEHLARSSR